MKLISDNTFLSFKWPPKMPSFKPREKKRYKHEVAVVSDSNPEYAYVLQFTSEKKARTFLNNAKEATNIVAVEYTRKELKNMEEGFIV